MLTPDAARAVDGGRFWEGVVPFVAGVETKVFPRELRVGG